MNKINIYDIVSVLLSSKIDYYLKDGNEVIEEFDYSKLSDNDKLSCVLIPKCTLKYQVDFANNFANRIDNKNFSELLSYYIEETELYSKEIDYNDEEFSDLNLYFSAFHNACEDCDIWSEFIKFRHDKLVKMATEWCIENDFKYYYEEPNATFSFDDLCDNVNDMLKNDERMSYYSDKV